MGLGHEDRGIERPDPLQPQPRPGRASRAPAARGGEDDRQAGRSDGEKAIQ
jgi:hypothetical protein